MKHITTIIAALSLGACLPHGDAPDPIAPADWSAASTPAGAPLPREEAIETGFPHELPEVPKLLSEPVHAPWSSGRALAFHKGELYVIDTENGTLVVLRRTGTPAIKRTIVLGGRPEQVVVGPDGTAFVSLRHDASVVKIGPGSSIVSKKLSVGAEPIGLALSAETTTLYVAVAGAGALVAIDTDSFTEVDRATGLDRPRHAAVGHDGAIFVSHRGDRVRRFIQDPSRGLVEDTGFSGVLRRALPGDNQLHPDRSAFVISNRVRGLVIHPEHGTALAVHHQSVTGAQKDIFFMAMQLASELIEDEKFEEFEEGGQGYGGHGVFSHAPHIVKPIETAVTGLPGSGDNGPLAVEIAFPVKDAATLEPLTQLVAQPSDINHHPIWSLAFVTGFGSDNVLVLNTAAQDPMRSPLGIIDVGMAPKAITFSDDGTYAYVLNAHTYTVSEIDLSPFFNMVAIESTPSTQANADAGDSDSEAGAMMMPAFENILQPPFDPLADHTEPLRLSHSREAQFGSDPLPLAARLGRRVYTYVYNDDMSHGFQFSCNSCHLEGGEDGLLWPAAGGLKQTPQLAGRLDGTGPFNWLGTEASLQDNMAQTIERMDGNGLTPAALESLELFLLKGMVRPPNPNVDPAGLTAAQERGKVLFNDPVVACASCHSGTAYANGLRYDVGTANDMEYEMASILTDFGVEDPNFLFMLNTPSLRDLFATSPYLHDGSMKTLMGVLDKTAKTMGYTAHLSKAQKEDLVAYLLTL